MHDSACVEPSRVCTDGKGCKHFQETREGSKGGREGGRGLCVCSERGVQLRLDGVSQEDRGGGREGEGFPGTGESLFRMTQGRCAC